VDWIWGGVAAVGVGREGGWGLDAKVALGLCRIYGTQRWKDEQWIKVI
jgi:hypothetical protein